MQDDLTLSRNKHNQAAKIRLYAAESQKRLKLPNLGNNIEISTNQSSIKKEKRSQSTMRGGTHSRVTLHTQNTNSIAHGSIGYRKDSSLTTI